MKVDLNLLLVFDAVARFGSVTEAAQHLALSQPAVSHALNRLRAITGDRLFTRSGRGLVPTARAVEMAPTVRSLIAAARDVIAPQVFHPATAEQVFRIAASDYAAFTLMPAIMQSLAAAAPRVAVEVLPVGPKVLQQMELGQLDLSFWGAAPPPSPAIYKMLFEEHYVGIARQDHPLFAGDQVTLENYLHYPHAAVSLRTPGANAIDRALADRGLSRQIGLMSHSFAGNLAALAQTDLIASLPSRLCQHLSPGLRSFALPLAVPAYPYGLLWHARTDQLASQRWLRDLIAQALHAPD